MTVVVQGFGNVGSYYALFMQQEGAKVIAISDSGGGIHNAERDRRPLGDRAQAGARAR